MNKMVDTKGLSNEEWLAYRRKGIGGSDASIIMGINKYRSVYDLWDDKCGIKPAAEQTNEYAHFGHVLESVIRREFMDRTGLKVRLKNAILRSDEYPWMLADLDGIVREPDGSHAIFEAKTASEYKKSTWEKEVPAEYVAQLQHYMAVTGYDKAYIAALVGGNYFCYHVVYRDEAYISELIRKESVFWRHVMYKTRPRPDASESTAKYLDDMYAESNGNVIELPESAQRLIDEYKETDNAIKALDRKKTGISNQLKELMQSSDTGSIDGKYVVRWTPVNRSILDSERLKMELGEKYQDYLKKVSYRKLTVA